MPFYFNKLGLNISSLVDFYPGSEFLWLIFKSLKIRSFNSGLNYCAAVLAGSASGSTPFNLLFEYTAEEILWNLVGRIVMILNDET